MVFPYLYFYQQGWINISSKGNKFRMTAEQVLNHKLPAMSGIKPNIEIRVEHSDTET